MKWFKHYASANSSDSLENLLNELGFEGYGRYWRFLEFLCQNFDGESISFRVHNRTLRDCMRFKSKLKLRCFMNAIGLQPGYTVRETENHFEIEAPILLDLKDRDFKKSRKVRGQNAPKNKIKNKDKDIDKEKERFAFSPDDLIKIYNSKAPPKKKHNAFFLAPKALEKFEISTGFPGMDTLEGWSKIFEKAFASEFLKNEPWCNLMWLLDADNAQKVLENSYANSEGSNSSPDEFWKEFDERRAVNA